MKACEVCNLPISAERLQMQPRVVTCSTPACARENRLEKGRRRAKRQWERRKENRNTEA